MYSHLACQSFLYIQFARSLNSDMNLHKKIHYGPMNLMQVDFSWNYFYYIFKSI